MEEIGNYVGWMRLVSTVLERLHVDADYAFAYINHLIRLCCSFIYMNRHIFSFLLCLTKKKSNMDHFYGHA